MERYVFEITSYDKLNIDGEPVALDSFIALDDDNVCIQGYYVNSGDDFQGTYSLDDVVRIY